MLVRFFPVIMEHQHLKEWGNIEIIMTANVLLSEKYNTE